MTRAARPTPSRPPRTRHKAVAQRSSARLPQMAELALRPDIDGLPLYLSMHLLDETTVTSLRLIPAGAPAQLRKVRHSTDGGPNCLKFKDLEVTDRIVTSDPSQRPARAYRLHGMLPVWSGIDVFGLAPDRRLNP